VFLIQDKMKTETFLAATSLFTVGVYAGILTRFEKWGGLSLIECSIHVRALHV
jgi:hypothetical protein